MISIINYYKARVCAILPQIKSSVVVLVLILSLISPQVRAQEQDQALLKQEFEESFQQMIKDPSNVDITLKYARIAVNLGNYEAAIPPLERILIFNPELPKIKLELGILYYRLNSVQMAKAYFEDAVKSKDVSDEVRSSANDYLSKIKG